MLNFKNFEDIEKEDIKKLLSELRSKHVSRFPIDVEVAKDGHTIKFMDSRFPNDNFAHKKDGLIQQVGFLYYAGVDGRSEKPAYTIHSRLIQNDRYASYNDDYHTRTTTDLNKMLKYLKEYIKPFTALEIADRTKNISQSKLSSWIDKPDYDCSVGFRNVGSAEIIKIFVKLKELGIPEANESHARINREVVPAYLEGLERRNLSLARTHVFVNPDHTVQLTHAEEKPPRLDVYDSMESVPHEIQQQVAMLQLCQTGQYLGNVGIKMSDSEYWVDFLSK
jgi:hypothetical protein